jgi:hypothetical protein
MLEIDEDGRVRTAVASGLSQRLSRSSEVVNLYHIDWLGFLNTYRTMCLAPSPQFRRILEEIRDIRLAA